MTIAASKRTNDPSLTEPDCTLDGKRIRVTDWSTLTPEQLQRIVENRLDHADAEDYAWSFTVMPIEALREATYDGGEPDGGWKAAYQRQGESDAAAVRDGSPQYAGRAEWLRDHWVKNTAIYPLYVVDDDEGRYVADGLRRLAGAFYHNCREVCVLLGTPR